MSGGIKGAEGRGMGCAQGTDVWVRGPASRQGRYKRSALHWASAKGLAGTVAQLLALGADATLTDKEGKTAVEHAGNLSVSFVDTEGDKSTIRLDTATRQLSWHVRGQCYLERIRILQFDPATAAVIAPEHPQLIARLVEPAAGPERDLLIRNIAIMATSASGVQLRGFSKASKPVKDTAAHIAPPSSSNPVPVFLKELDGTQHTVNIHLSDSVAALKAEICKLKSWGADAIRLLYKGKQLAPESASLSSFHVQRHSVIYIIFTLHITPPQEEEEEEEECCICYGATISRKDAAELPSDTCKHAKRSVCDDCLARHVQAEVSEKGLANRKVCCPQEGCKAIMAHHNVQRWAIASVFETYDTLLLRAHLQSLEDFRWCAWPGCGSGQIHPAMDQNPIIKCIKCKRKTCFTHRCQWHEGRTCRQYDQDAAECEEVALLQALEGGGNLRKCPKCG